ncbi:MAG: GGDEF domain-containing protein [Desulfovibrio sp.]|jgi:diguanylate cyclase (GGDEF)-like protein|nr:GGDEF domain-containing protein [Desulfovibrio sp.]
MNSTSPGPDENASRTAPDPSHQAGGEREEQLLKHFLDIVTLASCKAEALPEEFAGIENAQALHDLLWGIRRLAFSLSNGQLEYQCRERGFVVGALKAFQSNLRHLTWQAQRIAGGEYHHRVSFLGDFSIAFNQMAEQLGTKIQGLTSLSEEYKDMSYKDALTGLYNRKAFSQFSGQYLAKSAGSQAGGVLIMADIDKFKSINDTYGHLCGDEVLRSFAAKLSAGLRPKDICCRYGGEEFIILMPETSLEAGVNIAERLRASIENLPILFEGKQIRITASFGLSEVIPTLAGDIPEEYINDCIRQADENLYKAKETGRNRVVSA